MHARVDVNITDPTVVVTVRTDGPNDVIDCIRKGADHMLNGPTLKYKVTAKVDEVRVCP